MKIEFVCGNYISKHYYHTHTAMVLKKVQLCNQANSKGSHKNGIVPPIHMSIWWRMGKKKFIWSGLIDILVLFQAAYFVEQKWYIDSSPLFRTNAYTQKYEFS